MHKHTFHSIALDFFAGGGLENDRLDAKERLHRRPGFHRMGAGQGGHQVAARFRLPPCINDGALPAANDFIVPVPRFGVDRLAYGAKQLEAAQIAFRRNRCLGPSTRECGGGGVELVRLCAFRRPARSGRHQGRSARLQTSVSSRHWPAGRKRYSCGP